MKKALFPIPLSPREGARELYFRGERVRSEGGGLVGEKGAVVSFDTYFGLVFSAKMRRYCEAEAVGYEICGSGKICAQMYTDKGELLSENVCDISNTNAEILARFVYISADSFFVYLKLTFMSNDVRIDKITAIAECDEVKRVSPAIVICTYHREKCAVRNALTAADALRKSGVEGEVIVVDNGGTLGDFPDHTIRLIKSVNCGGSGGFARGMEYAARRDFTHIMLMDDDVDFEPAALERLFGFLSTTRDDKLCVAGSMLFADEPTVCFEAGGYFDIISGSQTGCSYGLDMTKREALCEDEHEKTINYGGWWLFCMPVCYAKSGLLPLPFFIKYDDVEYALRCGMDIVTLSGVGVWHERFDGKYNADSEYYNVRNYLLTRSLHGGISRKEARRFARGRVREKAFRQQYNMARAASLGYRDYRRGIEYIRALDAEKNHEYVRGLNYPILDEEELYKRHGVRFSQEKYERAQSAKVDRKKRLLLYGQLIPAFLCKKDYATTDIFFDRKEMYFGYKRALHFDRRAKKGYVTKKSLWEFVKAVLWRGNI